MENEINLKYQLSESELMDAIRAQSMRTWSFRFLVGFIVVMFAYVIVQQFIYGSTIELLIATVAPLVLVTIVLIVFTYWNPLVRRRIRQEPKYVAEQTWQFSEDSVHWKTEYSEATTEWKAYPKFVEDKKYFIIFLQSNAFTPIPKRAFASADEMTHFRELLKRKIPNQGNPRN